jgi:hypothetical protein
MLRDNLKALHLAFDLMHKEPANTNPFTQYALQDALRALAAMIGKTNTAKFKRLPGISQQTLLQNRLQALRAAEALTSQQTFAHPH